MVFEVITFLDVLEHLPRPSEVISKAQKLLKKEGLLVIRVPNEKFLRLKMRIIRKIFGKDFYLKNKNLSLLGFYAPETHIFNFNQNTLEVMLQKFCFIILKVKLGKFCIGTGKIRFLIHYLLFYIANIFFLLSYGRINYGCSIIIFARK